MSGMNGLPPRYPRDVVDTRQEFSPSKLTLTYLLTYSSTVSKKLKTCGCPICLVFSKLKIAAKRRLVTRWTPRAVKLPQ